MATHRPAPSRLLHLGRRSGWATKALAFVLGVAAVLGGIAMVKAHGPGDEDGPHAHLVQGSIEASGTASAGGFYEVCGLIANPSDGDVVASLHISLKGLEDVSRDRPPIDLADASAFVDAYSEAQVCVQAHLASEIPVGEYRVWWSLFVDGRVVDFRYGTSHLRLRVVPAPTQSTMDKVFAVQDEIIREFEDFVGLTNAYNCLDLPPTTAECSETDLLVDGVTTFGGVKGLQLIVKGSSKVWKIIFK